MIRVQERHRKIKIKKTIFFKVKSKCFRMVVVLIYIISMYENVSDI